MSTGYVRNKQKLKGIRYMLFAVAAINAAVTIVISIISSFMQEPFPVYLQSLITGLCAYIIPITVYAKITGITAQAAEKQLYFRKCKPRYFVFAPLLGVLWQFVMIIISIPCSLMLGDTAAAPPDSAAQLGAAMLVVGVLPAIFEEILFRGIADSSMSELNSCAAVIFSSVMFAVLHADVCNFAGYICMGVILTGIVRRAGSIYPAMLFHFANNATALLLSYFNSELVYTPVFTIVMFAIGVIGFAAVYAAFLTVTNKPEKTSAASVSTLLGQSFMNIPILLCFVVLVATIAVMKTF